MFLYDGKLRVWYMDQGRGDTIVLLASQLVLGPLYTAPVSRLSKCYRVVTVEMPGCGRSSGVDHPWKVGEYAEWLVSFFDRIGIRHAATLIGHSNSGAVALQFAANYPERLKSLVLVDSIGAHPTHDLPQMLFGRLIDGISEAVLSLTSFPQLLFNFTFHTRNILNQIRLASAGNLRKTCRHVRVPVLLAWGKRDHTMPPSCAEDMKKLIPRVELYMSPTGSHDWLSTNSEEFSTVLTQFLLRT